MVGAPRVWERAHRIWNQLEIGLNLGSGPYKLCDSGWVIQPTGVSGFSFVSWFLRRMVWELNKKCVCAWERLSQRGRGKDRQRQGILFTWLSASCYMNPQENNGNCIRHMQCEHSVVISSYRKLSCHLPWKSTDNPNIINSNEDFNIQID